MAEISAKSFFHRLQTQTQIFAKFHFSIILTQKVRAKRKKTTHRESLFFLASLRLKSIFWIFQFLDENPILCHFWVLLA